LILSLFAQLDNPRSRVNDVEKPHRLKRRPTGAYPHRLKQTRALMRGNVIGPVVDDAVEGEYSTPNRT
jgi:hypothetical protein